MHYQQGSARSFPPGSVLGTPDSLTQLVSCQRCIMVMEVYISHVSRGNDCRLVVLAPASPQHNRELVHTNKKKMPSLLLQGGTVLIHGPDDKVTPTKTDVLVEHDRITKIETSIAAPGGCEVIDCTDKIISPGFVDTHHHMWQTPLKGLFGDSTFMSYMGVGEWLTIALTPRICD